MGVRSSFASAAYGGKLACRVRVRVNVTQESRTSSTRTPDMPVVGVTAGDVMTRAGDVSGKMHVVQIGKASSGLSGLGNPVRVCVGCVGSGSLTRSGYPGLERIGAWWMVMVSSRAG